MKITLSRCCTAPESSITKPYLKIWPQYKDPVGWMIASGKSRVHDFALKIYSLTTISSGMEKCHMNSFSISTDGRLSKISPKSSPWKSTFNQMLFRSSKLAALKI